MLNKQKYQKEIEEILLDHLAVSTDGQIGDCRNKMSCSGCIFDGGDCRKKVKDWLNSDSDILSNKEKQYLQNVVKPFQQKVKYICKYTYNNTERIGIAIDADANIFLPTFKKGTMYKGMKVNKNYTLAALGLKEINAEEIFKALGYAKKETDENITYFKPNNDWRYISFKKDGTNVWFGQHSILGKDEIEACKKRMEELKNKK